MKSSSSFLQENLPWLEPLSTRYNHQRFKILRLSETLEVAATSIY